MPIEINSKKAIRVLLITILLLVAIHAGLLVMRYGFGHGRILGIAPLFDLWEENNFPSFYSSMTLLFCSFLLALIGMNEHRAGGRFARYWGGLAILFAYLATDEMLVFHERLIEPVQALGASGIFYFAWVIPYGIGVAIVGIVYLRFLIAMPPKARLQLMLAAAVYLSGCLGMELIESVQYEKDLDRTLIMDIYVLIEETLEMLGVLLFIRALLNELTARGFQLQFTTGRNIVNAANIASSSR